MTDDAPTCVGADKPDTDSNDPTLLSTVCLTDDPPRTKRLSSADEGGCGRGGVASLNDRVSLPDGRIVHAARGRHEDRDVGVMVEDWELRDHLPGPGPSVRMRRS